MKVIRKVLLGSMAFFALLGAILAASYYLQSGNLRETLVNGSQIIDTESGPIEYSLRGDDGPVMLYLHGTPGGYDQVMNLGLNVRTLTPSRPGYLRTALEVGETPQQQAHAYLALLDALNIDSVIVMGASGGGPSAIAFSALYPERTLALIALEAVSMPMPAEDGSLPPNFLTWVLVSILNAMPDKYLVKILLPDPVNQQFALENPEGIADMKALFWAFWPSEWRSEGLANDLSEMNDLALPATEVTVPTLIIHGTADRDVPYGHAEFLAASISGAELYSLEGADHMMPFTHAEEIQHAIDAFFGSLEQPIHSAR